jgi:hypothetical protein
MLEMSYRITGAAPPMHEMSYKITGVALPWLEGSSKWTGAAPPLLETSYKLTGAASPVLRMSYKILWGSALRPLCLRRATKLLGQRPLCLDDLKNDWGCAPYARNELQMLEFTRAAAP